MPIHLGLIGHPLEHSLSPKIHAAALAACGLSGSYSLFPIAPNDIPGLQALLARLRAGEIHGLNVTIPHKQNVIPLLDDLTETAQSIGAVNTILLRNGRLIGENTDAPGFMADLSNFLNTLPLVTRHSSLVLGAGGSARAVTFALANSGWQVTIAARRPEQAETLAKAMQTGRSQIDGMALSAVAGWRGDLLVNTTPLGMTPAVDTSPWPEGIPLPPGAAVYDLVYNPRETRLVREARAAGLPATTGLGMLIEQAALAFEIWTGCQPPREPLWQAAEY
ncbi:MAG: shikimate dehydrogenase [Candidatus Villigracilaceae bacterium]